jgi:hypothetical protein
VPFSITSASEAVSPATVPNDLTPCHCSPLFGICGTAVKLPLPRARIASWLAYSSALDPVEYLNPPAPVPLAICWLIR